MYIYICMCVYITLYIICTACTRNFLKPVFLYIFLLGHPGGLPKMKQHLQVNAANHWTLCGLQAQGAQALLQKHWQWMAMNDCCAQGTPAKNITRSKFRAHTHTLSLSLARLSIFLGIMIGQTILCKTDKYLLSTQFQWLSGEHTGKSISPANSATQ